MVIKDAFNRANPNTLADLMRKVGLGAILRGQVPQVLRMKTPAGSARVLATLQAFALPDDCKGALITRAYARATAAAGTLGELAIQTPNTTPADAQIAIAPNGDIVVLAASAYKEVDVEFIPSRGDGVVLDGQEVVADQFAIPAQYLARGVVYLVAAEATVGGSTGEKVILAPAGVPAAGQAALDVAKGLVNFAAADAVTRCKVTLLVGALLDLDTVLETTDDTI